MSRPRRDMWTQYLLNEQEALPILTKRSDGAVLYSADLNSLDRLRPIILSLNDGERIQLREILKEQSKQKQINWNVVSVTSVIDHLLTIEPRALAVALATVINGIELEKNKFVPATPSALDLALDSEARGEDEDQF